MKTKLTERLLQNPAVNLLLQYSVPIRFFLHNLSYVRDEKFYAGLKEKFHSRPLLIVANGPSLNRVTLDDFVGVNSVGMNKIDLIFPRTKWRPDLIVCTNNLVVEQNFQSWLDWQQNCLLAWKSRSSIPRSLRSKVSYFPAEAKTEFSCDFPSRVGSAGTVTYACLQLAAYLRVSKVVIVGMDHSFSVKNEISNRIARVENEIDVNHFAPNYFSQGQLWGQPNLRKSEVGYEKARSYFDSIDVPVYDATVGGKCDIFRKISLAEARKILGVS